MAQLGFEQENETLQVWTPGSTEEQKTAVFNDLVNRLNGLLKQVSDLSKSNEEILNNNSLKIIETGTLELNLAAISAPGGFSNDSATFNHNLGYTPAYMVFLYDQATARYSPVSTGVIEHNSNVRVAGTTQYIQWIQVDIGTDENNLTISAHSEVSGDSVGDSYGSIHYVFKYFIFRETAN